MSRSGMAPRMHPDEDVKKLKRQAMDTAIVDVTEQKRFNDAREAQIPWKK
jgi:hypothetical protein